MSRKPTVVSLSENEGKSEAPSHEKKTTSRKTSSTSKKVTQSIDSKPSKPSQSLRKPRAMKPPSAPETEEEFGSQNTTKLDNIPTHLSANSKGSGWGVLFLASVISLITLGLGLWFTQIIEGLFARHEWLGWGASGLLATALLCLFAIIIREIIALWRLRKLGRIREDVMRAMEDDNVSSKKVLRQLIGLYDGRKEMQWHLSRLVSHDSDIIDDRDRLILSERYLMQPLDHEAKQIIATAAKRVSVVTAVNPAASLDVIFTGYQILRMLRQLTSLYGSRPGSVGTLRLASMVGSHLAVTGGLALSDTLIQQFLGKGLAGRLSAKLGEGTVNGIMTARIGIAALDLCRPMPFSDLERPGLKEFITTLAGSFGTPKASGDKDS